MRTVPRSLTLILWVFLVVACSTPDATAPPAAPVASLSSAPSDPVDDRPVILAFGNSLTAGHRVLASEAYPSLLQQELDQRGKQYRVINAGISGDTTSGGLARIDDALQHRPKFVILELGANDGLRGLPVPEIEQNLETLIRRFQQSGAVVLLAGITLPRNYGPDYIRDFEDLYRKLARRAEAPLIPFFLEGVAGIPELNNDDGIHPNAAGYRIVTANVLRTLLPML